MNPECLNRAPQLRNDVFVVVPAFNEASRIARVLADLRNSGVPAVVVDDGSHDGTDLVVRHFCEENASYFLLRHLINRGQGAALQTGIEFARSQGAGIIVTFDADGQHSSKDLPELVKPIQRNEADIVFGSRFRGEAIGIPTTRWLVLKLAVFFTRITTGLRLTDVHNGLRAFRTDVVDQLRISEDGMAHASEIIHNAARNKLRISEIPCTVVYTKESLTKGQSNSAAFRILFRLFVARLTR